MRKLPSAHKRSRLASHAVAPNDSHDNPHTPNSKCRATDAGRSASTTSAVMLKGVAAEPTGSGRGT